MHVKIGKYLIRKSKRYNCYIVRLVNKCRGHKISVENFNELLRRYL